MSISYHLYGETYAGFGVLGVKSWLFLVFGGGKWVDLSDVGEQFRCFEEGLRVKSLCTDTRDGWPVRAQIIDIP